VSNTAARRFGLPGTLRMRHDTHFVEQLGRTPGEPIGRLIPLDQIDPNPDQPRREIGDLAELVASVREKGVLEPILVRPSQGRYQIIAGERRYRAAREAELDEVPCVIRECSDAEVTEIALIENLQRRDLTPFEEADGLKQLADAYGYTHELMAERLGKSRTSVTEMLSLTAMPAEVRELCRLSGVQSRSLLLQVVRQGDPARMIALIKKIQEGGGTREVARRAAREVAKKPGRAKNYVFQFQAPEKTFALDLKFRKADVSREEVIAALRRILEDLTREATSAEE
jgi:ParB family chromosome partitioning protein